MSVPRGDRMRRRTWPDGRAGQPQPLCLAVGAVFSLVSRQFSAAC
jgi:hypothetical protein